MKVIIAGSRNITDYELVKQAINESGFDIHQIVSGGANGVDKLGEKFAHENRLELTVFMAAWKQKGKSAGIIRNIEMAEYADALIAVWDGVSRGTKHMIDAAKHLKLKVYVKRTT